jgi:alpha-beta hydrolase superfamily lysophospholipase
MRRRDLLVAAPAFAAACSPMVQVAGVPGADFSGPRLEEDRFVSFDGARLALSRWEADGEPWAVVVALHGLNDYAEAFTFAGPAWARAGITTYAYDQRGFGRSPQRGVWAGETLMAEDLRTFCRLLRARYPGALLAAVGESMGGAVAISAFASDRPPDAALLVLTAPAVWGWSSQPWLYRTTLWLGAHTIGSRALLPPRAITRRIRASDNIEHLRTMGRDPHMIFRTRIDALYGLVNLMQSARTKIARVGAPILYCYGANDQIIPEEPSFYAASKLKPTDRSAYYEQGWHLLTRDLQRDVVIADIAAFIRDPAAPPPSGAPPIPAPGTPSNKAPARAAM